MPWYVVLAFLLLLSSRTASAAVSSSSTSFGTCEPVKVSMCKSAFLGYNMTRTPNLAGHRLQADANKELNTFAPLVQVGCSDELQFFLCSVFAPMCVPQPVTASSSSSSSLGSLSQDAIGPCRPLCERVQAKCAPVMLDFGFPWPSVLNCSSFPPANDERHMCMPGEGGDGSGGGGGGGRGRQQQQRGRGLGLPSSLFNNLQTNPLFMQKVKEQISKGEGGRSGTGGGAEENLRNYKELLETGGRGRGRVGPDPSRPCAHLSSQGDFVHIPRLASVSGRDPPCFQRCGARVLLASDKMQTTVDVLIAVCAAVTASLVVLCLFLVAFSSREMPYPQKCLLYLSVAFAGLNAGLLFHAVAPREDIVCQRIEEGGGSGGGSYLTVEGHRNALCFLTFVLVYFFSLCTSSWMISTLTAWLCSELLCWPPRLLSSRSPLLHLLGWGAPAAATVAAALLSSRPPSAIEGDEVLGVCAPGGQTRRGLLRFVLFPEAAAAALQLLLLSVVGAAVAFGSNSSSSAPKTAKGKALKKQENRRMLAFCSSYFVIKILILACVCVEYFNKDLLSGGGSAAAVRAAVLGRVALTSALGMLTAAFVYLFGGFSFHRSICPCAESPSKKKKSPPSTEAIPFQSVKYHKQQGNAPTHDLNVTGSTWTSDPMLMLQQQQQQQPMLPPTIL